MTVDLEAIYQKWQNDYEFRQAFQKDPVAALEAAGFEVAKDDLDKIKALLNIDDSKNDPLDERINR